jgi:hypothetical protein
MQGNVRFKPQLWLIGIDIFDAVQGGLKGVDSLVNTLSVCDQVCDLGLYRVGIERVFHAHNKAQTPPNCNKNFSQSNKFVLHLCCDAFKLVSISSKQRPGSACNTTGPQPKAET